jgi:hypothetical protein
MQDTHETAEVGAFCWTTGRPQESPLAPTGSSTLSQAPPLDCPETPQRREQRVKPLGQLKGTAKNFASSWPPGAGLLQSSRMETPDHDCDLGSTLSSL